MSSLDSFANLLPVQTFVLRNVVSTLETSALNLTVGWWLFACSMKCVTSPLFIFQIEKKIISSIYLFQMSGFRVL